MEGGGRGICECSGRIFKFFKVLFYNLEQLIPRRLKLNKVKYKIFIFFRDLLRILLKKPF